MKKIYRIILEEIENMMEVRHINTGKSNWNNADTTNDKPLKDSETIVVYHGFGSSNYRDALISAKYGLSGKERISRTYSYENVNNPKGLFVSVEFKVAEEFGGSGIIIEFATKVSDLEAPVWAGQNSYFVQGDYTSGFESPEERETQRQNYRGEHGNSEHPSISQSDRPELANSLFNSRENQALFIGDLNPNMIKAFWVNDILINDRRTNGQWKRISRHEFLKDYYDKDKLDDYVKTFKGLEKRQSEKLHDRESKVFAPADDFDVNKFKEYLKKRRYNYDDFVKYYIKNNDSYVINTFFYPKQIEQLKKYYKTQ